MFNCRFPISLALSPDTISLTDCLATSNMPITISGSVAGLVLLSLASTFLYSFFNLFSLLLHCTPVVSYPSRLVPHTTPSTLLYHIQAVLHTTPRRAKISSPQISMSLWTWMSQHCSSWLPLLSHTGIVGNCRAVSAIASWGCSSTNHAMKTALFQTRSHCLQTHTNPHWDSSLLTSAILIAPSKDEEHNGRLGKLQVPLQLLPYGS